MFFKSESGHSLRGHPTSLTPVALRDVDQIEWGLGILPTSADRGP